jgi:hypothetical protein
MYISLGGNCSITYQLNKYNLRNEACHSEKLSNTLYYCPFDWAKIKINQLINVLENNFDNYAESLQIKRYSDSHQSYIITNDYSIQFAHEVVNIDEINSLNSLKELNDFKDKIKRRITRFQNLSSNYDDKITFIRIELDIPKSNYINNIIKLVKLIKNYYSNFVLKILIETNSYNTIFQEKLEYVEFIKFDSYSEDWKMDHINWSSVFEESMKN